LELGERRALKLLHPWLIEPGRVERFKLEARAAVKLKSDHVARVFDVGTMQGGMPYIVMEYLEGSNLAAYLAARGRLDVAEAVGLVRQACEGIEEAHRLGIVHRDLKPANLFVHQRADGRTVLKVLDFGVAKVRISQTTMSTSHAGVVVGTPRYMSPEQARSSAHVDPRADIWALGAILYELVTGRPAFDASSLGELTSKILREAPRPPRELRPDLPSAISTAILRCLEKDPERRFDSARELSAALAPAESASEHATSSSASFTASMAPSGRGGGFFGPTALALVGALAGALIGTSISFVEAKERRAAHSVDTGTSTTSPAPIDEAPATPRQSSVPEAPAAVVSALPRASTSSVATRPAAPATTVVITARASSPPPTGKPADAFGENRR
jgi:serine/threonine-protein kinase